jgi:hypothetical protein
MSVLRHCVVKTTTRNFVIYMLPGEPITTINELLTYTKHVDTCEGEDDRPHFS